MLQTLPKSLEPLSLEGIRPAGPAPSGLSVESVLGALREARATIAAYAGETERLRYVAEPAWKAVWDSGVFWLTVPKPEGGLGLETMDPIIEAIALIGESCLSTSWCAAQVVQQQWLFREFPEGFRKEVAQRHPVICAAGSSFPLGAGQRVDGGLRVSGRFRYGSNSMYAEWLFAIVKVEEPDGSSSMQAVFVPASEATVLDTWSVDGVIGSGSHDFVFDDLFVPDHRVQVASAMNRRQPDHPNPLLRVPLLQFPVFYSASPILGAARGAVAAYRARLAAGGPGGAPIDRALDHECLARAETSVRIVQLAMNDAAERIIDAFAQEGEPCETELLALRVQVSHAAETCKAVLRAISDASGTSAHQLGNPLQRALRDATMLATHATVNPFGLTEALGRMMVGLPAEIPGPRAG